MFNLTCFGWIFDAKYLLISLMWNISLQFQLVNLFLLLLRPKCLFYEGVRILSFILLSIYYSDYMKSFLLDSEIFYSIFWWFNLASFAFVFGLWSCGVSIKKEPIAVAATTTPVKKAD